MAVTGGASIGAGSFAVSQPKSPSSATRGVSGAWTAMDAATNQRSFRFDVSG
jgi:hypothetical protein